MKLPLKLMFAACEDADAARKWYEKKSDGGGERFLAQLRKTFQRIEENPQSYGVVFKNVRAAKVMRYPYVVYYRPEAERTVVVAVQHGRRKSTNWRKRLA